MSLLNQVFGDETDSSEEEYPVVKNQSVRIKDTSIFDFKSQYESLKLALHRVPDRVDIIHYSELFGFNPVSCKGYLKFLKEIGDITENEDFLIGSDAELFIEYIEDLNMNKASKIPVIKAFFRNGTLQECITSNDLYVSCKDYYSEDYRKSDLCLIGDVDYDCATSNDYLKWAKKNPYKYLTECKENCFFYLDNGKLAISDRVLKYKDNITFLNQFYDALEYKSEWYFYRTLNLGYLRI